EQGLATAQFNLGLKYERGEGVAKDHGKADKWLHKAADQGYAPAQETLKQLAVL
ncbi:MAG: tetratricopeptide repeat protein, partial [Burkholderiales bacterium]